jgi:hypothetical protein
MAAVGCPEGLESGLLLVVQNALDPILERLA